jgi:hypothetical protein
MQPFVWKSYGTTLPNGTLLISSAGIQFALLIGWSIASYFLASAVSILMSIQ